MNQDLIFQVTQLLHTTFASSDNALRKKAEDDLQALQVNLESFFNTLLTIAMPSDAQIDKQIRNSAAINLRKFIRDKGDNGHLTPEIKEMMALQIAQALLAENLEMPIKTSLGYALGPLLSIDADSTSSNALRALHPHIIACLQGSHSYIIGACKCIKAIFSGFSSNPMLFPLFKSLEDAIIGSCRGVLHALSQTNDVDLAVLQVEALHELCATMTTVLEFFEITEKHHIKYFKEHYGLAELWLAVLNLNLTDPVFGQPCFFGVSDSTLFKKLNLAKSQVLQAINLVFEFLLENRKVFLEEEGKHPETLIGVDMPECPLTNAFYTFLEPLTNSLQMVTSLPTFENASLQEELSELLIETFFILQKLAKENKFNAFFNANFRTLIVEVCLVCMRATQKDEEDLEESPEEFVQNSEDLCNRQESDTLKTAAVQCYEAICESIDGAAAFCTYFCCELIECALKHETGAYQYIPQYVSRPILTGPDHILAESGLIGLTVVSYTVGHRKDLVHALEHFIAERWELLKMVTSPLVQQRLCLFVHNYTEYLFINDFEWLKKLVLLVIEFSTPGTGHRVRELQASMTMNYFFTEEEIAYRLEELLPSIFGHLVQLIPQQHNIQFFEALQEIISTNFGVVRTHLMDLVKNLAFKIQQLARECINNDPAKKKLTIFIIKCWNVIRYIGAHREVSVEQVTQMEEILLPAFEFIQNPSAIEFDDDILLFEVSLMRKCQFVTKAGWTLFGQLPLVQQKYEGTFLQLFPILNCYIHYGREHLAGDLNALTTIVNMCGKCLYAVYRNKPNEAANSEGALVLQQILQTFPTVIDSLLDSIFTYTLERLTQPINHIFFTIRLLGVIFSGFCYNPIQTLTYLTNKNMGNGTCLDYFVEQVSVYYNHFTYPHDRKIAALGLIQVIQTSQSIELNCKLFQATLAILASYENQQSASKLAHLESQLKQLCDQGGHSPNEVLKATTLMQMNKKLSSEEIEAELALSTFLTPYSSEDEFDHFRAFLQRLQQSPALLQQLMASLNRLQYEQLAKIVRSRRVTLTGFESEVTDIRRVVKTKKTT